MKAAEVSAAQKCKLLFRKYLSLRTVAWNGALNGARGAQQLL